MAEADVIIAWSFASVPKAVQAQFSRPTKFIAIPTPVGRNYSGQIRALGWPTPVRGILKKYAPGVEPLRIAALGFSESCGGVLGLLKSGDGARFDSAIAIDGIHTDPGKHLPPGVRKQPMAVALKPWFAFARLAAIENDRLCVITHSSVEPPYASTTATAGLIWQQATGSVDVTQSPTAPVLMSGPVTINVGSPPADKPYSLNYPAPASQAPRRKNGLMVLGYNNLDGPGYADHIYQAKVILPLVLGNILATRWNAIDPKAPGQTCYIA